MKATFELTKQAVEWLLQNTEKFGLDDTMNRLREMGVTEMDRNEVNSWCSSVITEIAITKHLRRGGFRRGSEER